jgi:hypothetical protein
VQGQPFSKLGKNNKLIVKKLIKVVIDDVEYEIACTMDYVKFLDKELDRYKKIENYLNKLNSATKQNDIIYYKEYVNMLLRPDETIENFTHLYQEFQDAYNLRKNILKNLHKEIKIIKKLKV